MNDINVIEKNKAFYSSYAPHYDKGREAFFYQESKRVQKDFNFINQKIPLAQSTLLDIGSGTGFYSLAAALQGANTIHCLDLNSTFLQIAKTKILNEHPYVNVTCHENDMHSFFDDYLEKKITKFNVFTMGSVLQYVPNHQEILSKMATLYSDSVFYITSNKNKMGAIEKLFSKLIIPSDYTLHRLIDSPPPPTNFEQKQSSVDVELKSLKSIFERYNFEVKTETYTTYHTGFFNLANSQLKKIWPSIGTHFTLLASPKKKART